MSDTTLTPESLDKAVAEKEAQTEAVNKATSELAGHVPAENRPKSRTPRVGSAVLVSFHDRHHIVHSTVAHVLAVAGSTDLNTPEGYPALTVAYPDPEAEPRVLQGPKFHDAYVRKVGVVHYTHPEARAARHSIVWGHAIDADDLPDHLLEGPKHSAVNSVYERHQPEVNMPDIAEGLHGSPRLRSEDASEQNLDRTGNVIEPLRHETRLYDDGSSATGPGPLPLNSPDEEERLRAETRSRIPAAPTPAQDSAIAAADLNAHNAAVAADQAVQKAKDAADNAEAVHNA